MVFRLVVVGSDMLTTSGSKATSLVVLVPQLCRGLEVA
jgi:hypothetical protein